jgi:squalene-hopene/tetraprenyl-beta-curcumene cyclase
VPVPLLRYLLVLLTVAAAAGAELRPALDESLAREAAVARERGVAFLLRQQAADGSWSGHPGITAVAVLALARAPADQHAALAPALARGADYLARQVRADGGIGTLPAEVDVYSTAASLMALTVLNRPADAALLARLEARLLANQLPTGYGYQELGFRYGGAGYPDLSNTHWALEALYLAQLRRDPTGQAPPDAAHRRLWRVSAHLILACQVGPGTGVPADQVGGFTYYPLDRPAGPRHATARAQAPVWGSLTYGAYKSLRYAGLPPDDERLRAAAAWLDRHFTVRANPGLDEGGLYYYLYMLASAQLVHGGREGLVDGWRSVVVQGLLTRQRSGGEWQNHRPLWLEQDPHLCTAYALLTLFLATAH